MPGIVKFGNIILKRGIIQGDTDFYKWISTKNLNTIERRDVVIHLLDEDHNPAVTWKVKNAFPVRYSGPVLNSMSNSFASEELELAHEGLEVMQ